MLGKQIILIVDTRNIAKTPHELFGDCLDEYNKVQEIKKNLIK
jgi:hypothetical protein